MASVCMVRSVVVLKVTDVVVGFNGYCKRCRPKNSMHVEGNNSSIARYLIEKRAARQQDWRGPGTSQLATCGGLIQC